MNLNEALDILKKNKYLVELTALPKIYDDKYGSYAKMTKQGRDIRNLKNTYIDDEHHKDHEGKLWLDVKQKDHFTLTLAALSGLLDSGKINKYNDGLKYCPAGTTMKDVFNLDTIKSKTVLLALLCFFPSLKELLNKICGFLEDNMGKKHLRVYRGLRLDSRKLAQLYKKDKFIFQSPIKLVQYLDNTTKEFNSFSVSEKIARDFGDYTNHIIFSGEIDNNDVNWAFTAYLMGRHGTISEAELNLNNLKRLKNVRIDSFNITEGAKKEAKLFIKHPDLDNAFSLPAKADYFLIRYNDSRSYFLCDNDCKKISDKPVQSTDTKRGYIKILFNDDTSCLIVQKTGKILFKNGCDKILRIHENNVYVKNGDYYYIFDENENILYKTQKYDDLRKQYKKNEKK